MERQPLVHQVSSSLVKAPPDEVAAGDDVRLNVRVSCSAGCDLGGKAVRIMAEDTAIRQVDLGSFDGSGCGTGEFRATAPIEPGTHTWTVTLAAEEEEEGVLHEGGSIPFTFVVRPHITSLAVWGIPSPISPGASFKATVGAKCSLGCDLAGAQVRVSDSEGTALATGALSDAPDSELGLYWTEVMLEAPSTEGYHAWKAGLALPELVLAHEAGTFDFGVPTVKPAECVITVEVADKETNTPIRDAEVYFAHQGPAYRGRTDEQGSMKLELANGEYEVIVSAAEPMPQGLRFEFRGDRFTTRGGEYKRYVPEANKDALEDFRTTVRVDGDMVLKVELVAAIEPVEVDLDHRL